jgi:hypothetical protein
MDEGAAMCTLHAVVVLCFVVNRPSERAHEREGRREAGTVESARAHEREHLLISVVAHMAPGEQKRESAHTRPSTLTIRSSVGCT